MKNQDDSPGQTRDEDPELLDVPELRALDGAPVDRERLFDDLDALAAAYADRRGALARTLRSETGYPIADCRDLVDVVVEYFEGLEDHWQAITARRNESATRVYPGRYVSRQRRPYGDALVITPANATLPIAPVTAAAALVAGNSVTVRPSSSAFGTARLALEPLVDRYGDAVSIAFADARDVVRPTVLETFDVLHYTGSSRHYPSVTRKAAEAGIESYVEGTGNGIFVVDARPEAAAATLVRALTRCNGRLCTTPSGVLVDSDIAARFDEALAECLDEVVVGPADDPETDVAETVPEPEVSAPSYLDANRGPVRIVEHSPALAERELFGPYAWLRKYDSPEEVASLLAERDHGLNVTAFATDPSRLSRGTAAVAARFCVDADPTRQSPFAPWGAMAASGESPGTTFVEKFCRDVVRVEGDATDG